MVTVGNWPLVLAWPVDIFTSPRDFSTLSPNREKKIWSYDTVSEFFFFLLFLPSHKKLRLSSLSGSGSDYDVVVVVVLFFFLKKTEIIRVLSEVNSR